MDSFKANEKLKKLEEINEQLATIAQIVFDRTREDLEIKISKEYNETKGQFENILNRANKDFFEYMNQKLGSDQLETPTIRLPDEDSFKIGTDYDEYAEKIFKKERGGFCNLKVMDTVLVNVNIKEEKLKNRWRKEISHQKNISLTAATEYVNQNLLSRVVKMKEIFNGTARSYVKVVINKCEEYNAGVAEKKEVSEKLGESIKKLQEISVWRNRLNARL